MPQVVVDWELGPLGTSLIAPGGSFTPGRRQVVRSVLAPPGHRVVQLDICSTRGHFVGVPPIRISIWRVVTYVFTLFSPEDCYFLATPLLLGQRHPQPNGALRQCFQLSAPFFAQRL